MPSLQADHAASRSLRQARGQRPAGTRGEMTEPSQGLGAVLASLGLSDVTLRQITEPALPQHTGR
jgi:hypothetical protein